MAQNEHGHLHLEPFQKSDYRLAIKFAEEGMHFDWYAHGLGLKLYAWYFFHMELNKATRAWACTYRGHFQGVILAAIEGEQKLFVNPFMSALVNVVEFFVGKFAKSGAESYEQANARMLASFKKRLQAKNRSANRALHPQAEILFLAANPHSRVKGVGTLLLSQFERAAAGKLVFLYTDSGCTFQFYEHRGFSREETSKVPIHHGKRSFNLDCYLYAKQL